MRLREHAKSRKSGDAGKKVKMLHVDVNRLKGKTVERGLTGEKIAKALGIDQSTYYRKMGDGGGGFTLSQAITMSEVLSLSREERIAIFFAE